MTGDEIGTTMTRLPEHDRRLMLSFEGRTVPDSVGTTLENHDVSGVTLFRPHNYETPEQLKALNDQRKAAGMSTSGDSSAG